MVLSGLTNMALFSPMYCLAVLSDQAEEWSLLKRDCSKILASGLIDLVFLICFKLCEEIDDERLILADG